MYFKFWLKQTDNETDLGKRGEQIAATYLKSKRYRILAANFRNNRGRAMGEIDLIAERAGMVIFVEVKTRDYGVCESVLPEVNITRSKLQKLSRIAEHYIKENCPPETPYQFDAVSVWLDPISGKSKIKHLEHIFY